MKVAYGIRPHLGGTWSVFRTLRAGLAEHAIDLRWVAIAEVVPPSIGPDESACGEIVTVDRLGSPAGREALLRHLDASYDVVIANILAERWFLAALSGLPARRRVVGLVHSISHGTYRAAKAVAPSLDAIICPSRRMEEDLRAAGIAFGGPWHRIPHGVEARFLEVIRQPRPDGVPPRLLFAGRLEEAAKGIFLLPGIIRGVAATLPRVELVVAGSGPEEAELRSRCENLPVKFLGRVAGERMPELYAAHDILLMPSRWEGFPMALAEAMAVGVVPVASRLAGVTDDLIEHGRSGFLVERHEASAHAASVLVAAREADLAAMSAAARATMRERYSAAVQAQAYARLIRQVAAAPCVRAPEELGTWVLPPGLADHPVTGFLPGRLKNLLRQWRERFRRS